MLSYDEALKKAKEKKSQINRCQEYENAFVFSYDSGTDSEGGEVPIAIIKESGEALNFIVYATQYEHKLVKEFDV